MSMGNNQFCSFFENNDCWTAIHNHRIGGTASNRKQVMILLLGLSGSGKTQLGNWIRKTNKHLTQFPSTHGVELFHANIGNLAFNVTEIGGSPDIQQIWPDYFYRSMGCIFLIDFNDKENIPHAYKLLCELLKNPFMCHKPFVVLGTKLKDNDIDLIDFIQEYDLEEYVNSLRTPCFISAIWGMEYEETLEESLQWLHNEIYHNYEFLSERALSDFALYTDLKNRNKSYNGPDIIVKKLPIKTDYRRQLSKLNDCSGRNIKTYTKESFTLIVNVSRCRPYSAPLPYPFGTKVNRLKNAFESTSSANTYHQQTQQQYSSSNSTVASSLDATVRQSDEFAAIRQKFETNLNPNNGNKKPENPIKVVFADIHTDAIGVAAETTVNTASRLSIPSPSLPPPPQPTLPSSSTFPSQKAEKNNCGKRVKQLQQKLFKNKVGDIDDPEKFNQDKIKKHSEQLSLYKASGDCKMDEALETSF